MSTASFISTTIPYVNANPHLGHALEYVQADSYARHRAMRGDDVFFLSGSDENSLKNVLAAEQAGVPTAELVARNVAFFERLMKALGVETRHFIRTSVDPDHIDGAAAIWRRMVERGDVYAKEYEGLYCVGCEQFYTEAELVDGRCPEHLVAPELVRERNYFFRLSRYQDRILDVLERGEMRIHPVSRRNEVISFLRGGLEDISISRSSARARGWGITVPDDPDQVMYVWIDALANYVTALGWVRDDPRYERYWAHADQRAHLLGKGVIRFHAVYWPAMLASVGLPLPTDIVVHGYLTVGGQKLSKSLGNGVDPAELIDRYGTSAVRYFLLAECSPFADSDFTEERLVARYNGDLANGLGNLVSRFVSMLHRYRGGVVPAPGPAGPADGSLAAQVAASGAGAVEAMDRFDHREALAKVMELVRRTNAYIDERAPWHLAKAAAAGDAAADELLSTTLHHLAGAVRQLGRLLAPFLPAAAEQIRAEFGGAAVPEADAWLSGLTGLPVAKAPALFPRIDG
jgi:methionyl-tRNA synthetase